MCTVLRHRKARRKLITDFRGFSSIVGAVFAVLVIISLTATVFVWSLFQNNLYNNAVRTKNQLDAEQSSEKINAFNASYRVIGSTVSVSAPIQNLGYLSLQITRLWLKDINNSTGLYNFSDPLTYTLQPGSNATIQANVVLANVNSTDNFTSWLVTGRGNIIATSTSLMGPAGPAGPPGPQGSPGPPSTSALVSQGIGSISMDFKAFRSYVANSSNYLGTPRANFVFSYNEYVAFSINVTDLDPSGLSLNLTQNCYFWAVSPPVGGGAIKGEAWKIAKVDAYGKITNLGASDFVILPYNVTTTLYFGPYKPGGSNLQAGPVAVNLLLTGKVGSLDYGQNLPFIALIVTA